MLENKIKGPCWLDVRNYETVSNHISLCFIEAECLNSEDIQVVEELIPPPPLVVMSMAVNVDDEKKNGVAQADCFVYNYSLYGEEPVYSCKYI